MKVLNIPFFSCVWVCVCVCIYLTTSTSTHRWSPSLSACLLLLTVHCVISGSFQCNAEICKSALLVFSTSDRIILKHDAACLPVASFLLPRIIRLTEVQHIWPQQLFQAFPHYDIHKKKAVSQKTCTVFSQKSTAKNSLDVESRWAFWFQLVFSLKFNVFFF